ncbi:MAG TPA: hypothetical protein VEU76_06055 [Candidatus Udaeobacter sp.]|nr:hypothetical protein [Candidatus Udaeobacter sp.]
MPGEQFCGELAAAVSAGLLEDRLEVLLKRERGDAEFGSLLLGRAPAEQCDA